MESDEFFGTQPTNDGCNATNDTINCGVGTTLMDCDRGSVGNLNFSDLSDYFLWSRRSMSEIRAVSTVFRFDQPVNIDRISMWFWYAPVSASADIPKLALYSSNDDSSKPSNPVTIDISDSLPLVMDGQYRLNVDITDEDLWIHSLRILTSIDNSAVMLLSEVMFCGKHLNFNHVKAGKLYESMQSL